MKQLLLLTAIAIFASCDRNCDEAKDQYYQDYLRALQGQTNPAAIQEIQRQYNERVNDLDC